MYVSWHPDTKKYNLKQTVLTFISFNFFSAEPPMYRYRNLNFAFDLDMNISLKNDPQIS